MEQSIYLSGGIVNYIKLIIFFIISFNSFFYRYINMLISNLNFLKKHLSYNPTGIFTHKDTNEHIGIILDNGYEKIKYKNNKKLHVLSHRLTWQWAHGVIPDTVKIIHIDGNKLNNKLDNLMIKQ